MDFSGKKDQYKGLSFHSALKMEKLRNIKKAKIKRFFKKKYCYLLFIKNMSKKHVDFSLCGKQLSQITLFSNFRALCASPPPCAFLTISGFVLDEKFHRKALKFAIFLE